MSVGDLLYSIGDRVLVLDGSEIPVPSGRPWRETEWGNLIGKIETIRNAEKRDPGTPFERNLYALEHSGHFMLHEQWLAPAPSESEMNREIESFLGEFEVVKNARDEI